MNHFSVFKFGLLLNELAMWQAAALREGAQNGGRIIPELTKGTLGTVEEVLAFCKQVGFGECHQTAFWSRKHLSGGPNVSVIANEIAHLKEKLIGEAHERVFLCVANDRSGYADQRALFGAKVHEAFPGARSDIRAAGNCLATESPTAAVFHLMRVAEHGLRALARDRRVRTRNPLDLANWEEIIKQLEKAEQDIQGYPRTHAREAQFEFYHGAMMEFRTFKNLWRNRVMHTRQDYDRDQAHSAFVHVRDFIRLLATRISEKKRTPLIWKRA